MRFPTLFQLSSLWFCATVAGAQSIRVVDAANGPGTDFTSLPAAVAAAVSGDVLLVRPGSYAPFWVSGKDLHIFGAGPDACFIEGPAPYSYFSDYVQIAGVPSGTSFDLAGFTVRGQNLDLFVAYAGGPPTIGIVAVRTSVGTVTLSDFVVGPHPQSQSGSAGLFLEATQAHLRRCALTGGESSVSSSQSRMSPAAVLRAGANLSATECDFNGLTAWANAAGSAFARGGDGVDVIASNAALHACSAIGGSAHPCCAAGIYGSTGAVGGSGVRAGAGAFVRIVGSPADVFQGGAATGGLSGPLGSGSNSPGYALMSEAGGTIEVHGSPTLIAATYPGGTPAVLALGTVTLGQPALPRLSTTGVAINGGELDATQPVTLSLTSALPNAPFVLLLDIYPGFSTPFPGLQLGELLLSGVGGFIAGGELDATGAFSVSFVPSLLAPGAANAPLHLQAAVADFGAGQWRMSNAETRVFRL